MFKFRVFILATLLVASVVAVPATFAQGGDECSPTVTLTSAGVELSGCDEDLLVSEAEDMANESRPSPADLTEGKWDVRWLEGATDQMKGQGENPWPEFAPAAPTLWPEFPDHPNSLVPEFRAVACSDNPDAMCVPDGIEYGMAESDYMQDDIGDVLVPARHYRLITGDYNLSFDQCEAGEDFQGCALGLFNVGEVTSNFEDVKVNNAFTVWGRYWNGDQLPVAIVALLSHAGNNMLNLNSNLNPGGTNAGANCSVPSGCERVRLTFVLLSGNEVLAIGRTYVSR